MSSRHRSNVPSSPHESARHASLTPSRATPAISTSIVVNVPVNDLEQSTESFVKLGYTFNPRFTDRHAACLVISDTIYAMLLTHESWARFTPKQVCDTSRSAEVMIALSCNCRQEVDEIVKKALAAGGKTVRDPEEYGHAFQDLDGHIWEPFWKDPAHANPP